MCTIRLENVTKMFGELAVIPGIDLQINDGEFVVFVGPSGCGKSTLLRLIAGLEDISGGAILLNGEDVSSLPPAKRGLSMVFQSYALYPHMTVHGNIAFPLKMAGMDKAEIDKKVMAAAKVLNLTEYLKRKPRNLSGGQRQRVAIGRAIVREPSAFLFDEPLSNLDAALRVNMRLEITELHQQLGTTMVYVTHDQVEAMTMADKIVVLNRGNVEQVGSPMDLYRDPANLFVAGFIGSPRMNFVDGGNAARLGATTIGIRPEHIGLDREKGLWRGVIGVSEHLGSDTFLHVHVEDVGTITARTGGEWTLRHGETVFLTPDPDKVHRFDESGRSMARAITPDLGALPRHVNGAPASGAPLQ
ncbi:MAG: ABC transporter ATP-binding protein [Rhodospirillum sp.]|nr:ABC transporter ATP-binding protein [Rhodospirillum sp.]MCF8491010.1 ABC transporter ATP-binding protein [Rhodospirillum sp.]MCF8499471.1 ABC transporter ATP-binding protein [Rhodospirillum sp.]